LAATKPGPFAFPGVLRVFAVKFQPGIHRKDAKNAKNSAKDFRLFTRRQEGV